jgi:hypothetical protein
MGVEHMIAIGLDPSGPRTRPPAELMIPGRARALAGSSFVTIGTSTARRQSAAWCGVLVCVVLLTLGPEECEAQTKGRDPLLNGALVGAAVGAGAGMAFTYAVRDSDLGPTQYAYGALVFGALGAGVGVGVDALLHRAAPDARRKLPRMAIAPTVWRDLKGLVIKWKW